MSVNLCHSSFSFVSVFVLCIFLNNLAEARSLGVYGAIYDIKEQDALEWISQKLKKLNSSGELTNHQHKMVSNAKRTLLKPKPVSGLTKAHKPRTFAHDVSFILEKAILDADGKILFAKGTRVNPLNYQTSSKALLFLDGDDPEQVDWALNEHTQRGDLAKLILVNGAVINLMQDKNVRFYFDQSGRLIQHFKIEQVPAVVEQVGNQLQITEIKI